MGLTNSSSGEEGPTKRRACLPCPGKQTEFHGSSAMESPNLSRGRDSASRCYANNMNYNEYLRTEHWRLLRGAKLQMAPKCERCGAKEEIEVHHKRYRESWYASKVCDLETLCHGCHTLHHAVGNDIGMKNKLRKLQEKEKEKPVPDWVEPGQMEAHAAVLPQKRPWGGMRHHARLMA